MQIIKMVTYRCLFIFLLLCSNKNFYAQSAREQQVKAAFLFNFSQFVDWPPTSFSSAHDTLVIGMLGKDMFSVYLRQTVAGEKVNNHPLAAKHYTEIDDVEECHILYINLEERKLEQAIQKLKGKNVLTVGDAPDFLEQGGMIRFFTKDNKIQLQVNPVAVKAANLVISSRMMRLVEIYTPKK